MKNDYSAKLQDPRWQRRRLEVLNLARWKCSSCGDERSPLHVHHLSYIGGLEPWEYPDSSMSVLCEKCHATSHGKKGTGRRATIVDFAAALAAPPRRYALPNADYALRYAKAMKNRALSVRIRAAIESGDRETACKLLKEKNSVDAL